MSYESRNSSKPFKQCSMCKVTWESQAEFLEDDRLTIVGYQVNFGKLTEGFFLFNHSCGTTLAIEVGKFQALYDGPIFAERATGGDDCMKYCLHINELRPCPAKCECAYVREIIQIIKNWTKNPKD
jgi:hypothetical protein